jgi:hypothetical protein
MRILRREIEIDAPPSQVWRVVSDFESYPAWNPFMRSISGRRDRGAKLEVRIAPPGGRPMTFRPTVQSLEEGRELRWLGRLLVPGLFDGEHSLLVEPLDRNHSRFVQSERFGGVLVGVLGGVLEKTEAGFEQMNRALKERAEQADRDGRGNVT